MICEKPLTISPWNIDALAELEQRVRQARLHRAAAAPVARRCVALKRAARARTRKRKRAQVNLSYITRRGPWYQVSWKGDPQKSGGVAMNIGIHFFDLLLWLFGTCQRSEVHLHTPTRWPACSSSSAPT